MKRFMPVAVFFSVCAVAAISYVSCGHTAGYITTGQFPPGDTNIVIIISDPAACVTPGGAYSHIYVTITDVAASPNSSVSENGESLVDLTPHLRGRPVQVDLLGEPDGNCQLAMLARGTAPAGVYRTLRVSLLEGNGASSAIPGGNHCNEASTPTANCVVTSEGMVLPLILPPGGWFDIGPDAMPDGQFVVGSSGTTRLNLSLDGCDSLLSVIAPGTPGSLSFVPTARAAVFDRATAITGRVVDATSGKAIEGRTIVAIEQKDASGIDRIVMSTVPAADGSFALCPIPPGNYDLAVTAVSGAGIAFAPTLLMNVPAGAAMGDIALVRAGGLTSAPGMIAGQVSLLSGKVPAFGTVRVSALASAGMDGSEVTFTVPLPASRSGTLFVAGSDAILYFFTVPVANPRVGVFSENGTIFSQNTREAPAFTVEARGCGSTKTTVSPVRVISGGRDSAPVITISTCGPA